MSNDLRPEPIVEIVSKGDVEKLTERAEVEWRKHAESHGIDVSNIDPKDWAASVMVGPKLLALIGADRLQVASKAFYAELDKAYREAIEAVKRGHASNGGGRIQ